MRNPFKLCSFCGHSAEDICEFRMWRKTDEQDVPIDDYLVTCRSPACLQKIEDDSALFIEVPWGAGGPGRFMLLCGDCPHRNGFRCTHKDLKANGGSGLEVRLGGLPGVIACGPNGCRTFPKTAVWCAGNPDVKERP